MELEFLKNKLIENMRKNIKILLLITIPFLSVQISAQSIEINPSNSEGLILGKGKSSTTSVFNKYSKIGFALNRLNYRG